MGQLRMVSLEMPSLASSSALSVAPMCDTVIYDSTSTLNKYFLGEQRQLMSVFQKKTRNLH